MRREQVQAPVFERRGVRRSNALAGPNSQHTEPALQQAKQHGRPALLPTFLPTAEAPCPTQQHKSWPFGASCWIRSNSFRFAVKTGPPAFAAVKKISASFKHSLRW
jgi:hypothetical protein